MARFLQVADLQEPFDLGPDPSGRARYAFNIVVTKTASDTFDDELVAVLQNASVGTLNSNIFVGRSADIPTGDGPYLSIIETGGYAGLRIHDQRRPAYPRPGAQIVARATSPVAARTMARAAYNALVDVVNATVTP